MNHETLTQLALASHIGNRSLVTVSLDVLPLNVHPFSRYLDSEGRMGHVMVGKLDVQNVQARFSGLVGDQKCSIALLLVSNLRLAWALHTETQATVARFFGVDQNFVLLVRLALLEPRSRNAYIASIANISIQNVDQERTSTDVGTLLLDIDMMLATLSRGERYSQLVVVDLLQEDWLLQAAWSDDAGVEKLDILLRHSNGHFAGHANRYLTALTPLTHHLGHEGTALNRFVTELDVDGVGSRRRWCVRHANATIFVVLALDLRLRRTLHGHLE